MGESRTTHYCIPGRLKTISGKEISLPFDENNVFDIEDIAHALSNICRFNGHINQFYSVAHHSLLCWALSSTGLTREQKRHIFLHDAHEAYICDIPTPLKMLLPDYRGLEVTLAYDVAKAFHFNKSYMRDSDLVKSIDRRAYLAEAAVLGRREPAWSDDEHILKEMLSWPNFDAKKEFLNVYSDLAYYEREEE